MGFDVEIQKMGQTECLLTINGRLTRPLIVSEKQRAGIFLHSIPSHFCASEICSPPAAISEEQEVDSFNLLIR